MKTTILYDNQGMPVMVPDNLTKDYLKHGYRSENPNSSAIAPVELTATMPQLPSKEVSNKLAINSAELKDIVAKLGIATANAKKVIENRPYKNMEDLLEKIPSLPWMDLDPLISYE